MAALPSGTVSFLFTDVEGSTRLLAELGAERYADVLAEHRRVLRAAFAAHGGVEVSTEGDSFFVAFARAGDALASAAQARDSLGGAVLVRMGIHTGEPLVTNEGYVGMDVHRAARIAAAGHGGQILVSQSTRDLVPGDDLRDLGEHRLKDLTRAERIWQLGNADFPPLKSLHKTRLPVAAAPIIGREAELARIKDEIRSGTRLLTVTGSGGTGKTRLAVQAAAELADDFAGGTYFVPLASVSEAAAVQAAVARALELRPDDDVVERLCASRVLLVLDNAEHLPGVEHEVAKLRVGDAALLVTSRAPLHLSGERELPLDPLPENDAVKLFLARAADRGHVVPADDTARAVCRRLDNLPFALELAAARLSVLSPTALLERLDHALRLLTGGAHDLPERQRTLRATIEWSYDLLGERAQRALRRLAIFRGGFTLDAAASVADADLDTVAELVEKSLLKRLQNDRYLMLETIREFGLEEHDADLGRVHARYYLEHFRAVEDELRGPRDAELLAWYDAEAPNAWVALDTLAGSEEGWELADLLGYYWIKRGQLKDGVRWLRHALGRTSAVTAWRGRALVRLSDLEERLGRIEDAAESIAQAEAVAAETGDRRCWYGVHRKQAAIEGDRGDLASALEHARKAVELGAQLDERSLNIARHVLANVLIECRAQLDEAETLLRQLVAYLDRIGDRSDRAVTFGQLGSIAFLRGDGDAALAHLNDAVGEARTYAPHLQPLLLQYAGFVMLALGRRPQALRVLGEALELALAHDAERDTIFAIEAIAVACVHTDLDRAGPVYATVVAERERRGMGLPEERREVWERELAGVTLDGDAVQWEDAVALARSLVERNLD